jgi:hypothetical protein
MLGSRTARKIAAGGVSAAFAAGSALLAVPANAATAAPLNYTCTVPFLGAKTFTVTADTTLPDSVVAGSPLSGKADFTVTVPDDVRGLMAGLGDHIEGTADVQATSFGAAATLAGVIPSTAVPTTTGPFAIPASAPISGTAPTTPGTYQLLAGDFTANAKLTKTDGSEFGPVALPCTLDAGQNAVVDTVTVTAPPVVTPPPPAVVKVASTSTVKAKYAAKAKKIVAKVAVKGADGKPGTGKVKVTLKLGKKTKTVSATLSSLGKAKAVFKKITKPGKYKITVAYAGSDTQNASTAKTVLKIT